VERTERHGELELIRALARIGLYAAHIDCTIDGFPDLIVFGKRILLIEMKACKASEKISRAMESSQSVFINTIGASGFRDTILCVYDAGLYTMYSTSFILRESMEDMKIEDMGLYTNCEYPAICKGQSSDKAARFIESVIKARRWLNDSEAY